MAKCGAHSKSTGKPCTRTAMDNGRCYVHGGNTPKTNQNAVKHGIYASVLSDQEKSDWDLIEVGKLEHELKVARLQLKRAMEFEPGHEHYRPDAIDKMLNTIGRLEKQHAEITDTGEDSDRPTVDGFLLVPYETKSTD
jgi:hypothetical protein